jgi:hypothetical protein
MAKHAIEPRYRCGNCGELIAIDEDPKGTNAILGTYFEGVYLHDTCIDNYREQLKKIPAPGAEHPGPKEGSGKLLHADRRSFLEFEALVKRGKSQRAAASNLVAEGKIKALTSNVDQEDIAKRFIREYRKDRHAVVSTGLVDAKTGASAHGTHSTPLEKRIDALHAFLHDKLDPQDLEEAIKIARGGKS